MRHWGADHVWPRSATSKQRKLGPSPDVRTPSQVDAPTSQAEAMTVLQTVPVQQPALSASAAPDASSHHQAALTEDAPVVRWTADAPAADAAPPRSSSNPTLPSPDPDKVAARREYMRVYHQERRAAERKAKQQAWLSKL